MNNQLPNFARGRVAASLYFLSSMGIGFGVPAIVPGDAGGFLSMGLLLALVFVVGWFKGTGLTEVGLSRPDSWSRTLLLALAYAALAFVVFRLGLEPGLEQVTGVERDLSRFDYLKGDLKALLNTLLVLWLTAAFFEEVLFRGFLITNVASIFGNGRAAWTTGLLVSSTLFALVHGYQGFSGVLLTGLAGLFFGALFLLHNRNLWVPIIAHGVTDTSGATMVYLNVYDRVTSLLW